MQRRNELIAAISRSLYISINVIQSWKLKSNTVTLRNAKSAKKVTLFFVVLF